ncbi:nuclear transport factor 2 family protein [Streptomyces sp. NPDC058818]|uniref:nuclear transport factor 2 family protein n=1 Tax=Streptomyces sp. NPDC058818 TaxID=3346640 RepID=UPI00367B532D
MSSTADQVASLRAQLRVLTDRLEIKDLFDRYIVALDRAHEAEFDDAWYRTVFTQDVRFTFPIGVHKGVEGFAEFQRAAKARWARTHHLCANHVVELDGDQARLRVHQVATHLHLPEGEAGEAGEDPFVVSGYYDVHAVRTHVGWQFDDVSFHVVSAIGRRLPSMADLPF